MGSGEVQVWLIASKRGYLCENRFGTDSGRERGAHARCSGKAIGTVSGLTVRAATAQRDSEVVLVEM